MFVISVTYEVIHDRKQPTKSSHRNYVLYERCEDFPGRIEILSEAERKPEPERVAEEEPDLALLMAAESKVEIEQEPEVESAQESERQIEPEQTGHQVHWGLANPIEAIFKRRG